MDKFSDTTRKYTQQRLSEQIRKEELDLQASLEISMNASEVSVWKYHIGEHKFHPILGKILMPDGTTYEECAHSIAEDNIEEFHTIFCNLISGKCDEAHAIFHFIHSETGEDIYYQSELAILFDDNGARTTIIGTQKDVTGDTLQKQRLEEFQIKTKLTNEKNHIVQWDYSIAQQRIFTHGTGAIQEGVAMDGDTYLSYVHPEDRKAMGDFLDKMSRGKLDFFDTQLRTHLPGYKEYRYVILNTLEQRDKKGRIVGYTGIRRDTTDSVLMNTELTKLSQGLEESNALIMSILTQIPSAIFIKDITNGFRYVISNELYCQLFNYTEEQMVGYTDYEILSKEVADKFHEDDLKAMEYNGVYSYIEEITTGGKVQSMHTTKRIITTSNGRQLLIGVSSDISETIAQHKQLENSNEKLNMALEVIGAYSWHYDQRDEILCFDSNFASLGLDTEGMNSMLKFSQRIHPDDRQEFLDIIEAFLKKDEGEFISTYRVDLHNNGNYEWWECRGRMKILSEKGQTYKYIYGMDCNVTHHKQITDELRIAKERAEQSDKLKSAFLANMSHEIRTPLNAIVGFSELLAITETAEERTEYTNIISVNNELLLRLINDILDLSRIESGMIELKSETFDLSETCEEVYQMLKQKMTNPKIDFLVENPYDSCIVKLDRNRLKQVGINFVTNAIKYTAQGFIKMGYKYIDRGVKIYVQDTGIGIAKENYVKIFKRFEKFDSFAQGTGLGLSICKAIMDVQGGKIGFESEFGEGSYFWAWFPCEADIQERKESDKNRALK